MMSNSLIAALVASAYVLTLVLQLNPTLPLSPARLVPIATTVGVFYALHLTVLFYVVLVLRQLFAREVFSPAWVSVGVLTWLGAASAMAGAALMWANLRTFELVLEPSTIRQIANGAVTLVVSAAFFVVVALLRVHMGPSGRPIWSLLFVATVGGSIIAPLAARGRATPPILDARSIGLAPSVRAERPARVILIAVDAGSLDFITGATAEGRLPNFGRVLDFGAVMHLATVHPTSAEAVWAVVATGKLPQKNGVRSSSSYHLPRGGDPILLLPDYSFSHVLVRFGFLVEQPNTSATLKTRTLWNITWAAGVSVGVVG